MSIHIYSGVQKSETTILFIFSLKIGNESKVLLKLFKILSNN